MGVSKTPTRHISRQCGNRFAPPAPAGARKARTWQAITLADTERAGSALRDGGMATVVPDPTRHPRPRSGTYGARCAGTPYPSPRRPQEAPLQVAAADNTGVWDPGPPIGNGNRRPRPNPPSPTRIRHPRPRSGTYGARCAGTPRPPVRLKTVPLSVYRGTRSALILNAASGAAAAHHPLGNRVRRGTGISGRYQS